MTRSAPSLRTVQLGLPPLARWIGLTIAAGTLLAILGPLGSYMNGGAMRLLGYWIGSMLLGLMLYGSAYRLVAVRTASGSWRWWLGLIMAALLASIPEALATRAAAFRLWPELVRLTLPPPLWFAQTATIGLVAMTGSAIVLRRPAWRRTMCLRRPRPWGWQ